MTRLWYGGMLADLAISQGAEAEIYDPASTGLFGTAVLLPIEAVTFTAYTNSALTVPTSDLLDADNAVMTAVTPEVDDEIRGTIPRFQGPDGYAGPLWLSADGVVGYRLEPESDLLYDQVGVIETDVSTVETDIDAVEADVISLDDRLSVLESVPVSVREFDGTDDEVITASGGLSAMTFGTVAVLFKITTMGSSAHVLFSPHNSGGTCLGYVGVSELTGGRPEWFDGGSLAPNGANGSAPEDVWHLLVVRKVTGSAAPRFSIYNLDTGTWTHTAGSTAVADWTAPGGSGTIKMSFQSSVARLNGRMAVRAAWANSLPWTADAAGDVALEAAGLQDTLQAWVDAAPSALWPYNQVNVADGLLDIIGAADESSRVGTVTVTGDNPPGFSFLGFGSVVPTVERFTADGTWTKPAGAKRVLVEVQGAGGAGGGCAATGASQAAEGAGGGGGGFGAKWFDASALAATVAVVVGVGGTGVSNGTGNTGEDSSFGSHFSAIGGTGGAAMAATGGPLHANGGEGGGVADLGTGLPQIVCTGGDGGAGVVVATGFSLHHGAGGFTRYCGSQHTGLSSGNGSTGLTNSGAGGSGAYNAASQGSAKTGGAGCDGVVYVTTFF
jgi:hypothetical protein